MDCERSDEQVANLRVELLLVEGRCLRLHCRYEVGAVEMRSREVGPFQMRFRDGGPFQMRFP